jgi:hypothetical protein
MKVTKRYYEIVADDDGCYSWGWFCDTSKILYLLFLRLWGEVDKYVSLLDKLKVTFYSYYIAYLIYVIALKCAIGLHELVAMVFAVSFEIIIQRAVGNESCYPKIKTLIIITVL